MWGTVNDLSPMEDSSAQELSNIMLPDSPEDIPEMDQFGECCLGPVPLPPALAFHTGAALRDKEGVMEQEQLEGEREGCEHTEEADSLVSSLWNSTDSDRQTEEDEAELSDEPTGEPADVPTDETTVMFIEGHPPNDELAEGHSLDDELTKDHSLNDELTEDHLPDNELMETITVKCPPPRQELPLGSAQEENRVAVHASEDEMDCLC